MNARPGHISAMVVGFALVVLALAVLALLPHFVPGFSTPPWLVGLVAVGAWLALIAIHELAQSGLRERRSLRTCLEAVAHGQAVPPTLVQHFDKQKGELADMARLIGEIADKRVMAGAKPDQRLAAVLRALHDGVVVVTETGLISLINGPAKTMLGGERAAVGGSIFASVDRESLVAATARAQRTGGKPIEAGLALLDGTVHSVQVLDFGEHRGAVITIPSEELHATGEVELALDLHDAPPVAATPIDDTLLAELPVLVLDTETTGLDAARDSIVSVGAVRCHGTRIYRSTVLDLLVDPGRRIPARATSVHGIDDAMVAGKPSIAQVFPEIMTMMAGTVMVGHNIGFDLALLHNAAVRTGQAWVPPPRLDILLLAAALNPDETALELDHQAARLGINISGRHTALGDALVTAEIWVRLVPQLERQGVKTLGAARAFSRQARQQMERHREMGWDEDSQLGGNAR
ncbi:DNA polymerase III, epsilon subunit [Magnetospirillum sp. LM-5]|uniref:3'-5' exonuclease n=1 Tax=Magnetospirillum sp. LM-5 TaxID=2681466 RepID=UPI0013802E60|nr:exonuclease domain-containing protein [Magnetospirillum sp. LM-5]CAA7623786.1 DNA polymerase III, epsilon subunit [Magnetospirillum sp. LM-5]